MFLNNRSRPRHGGKTKVNTSDEAAKEKEPRVAGYSTADNQAMSRSRSRLFDVDNPGETRVHLNVGGQKHETFVSTLASIPDTRLAWIAERAIKDPRPLGQKREYFFDRNPTVFTHILNYYRTNKLHCPRDVCGPLFEEELIFWGIDEKQIETCCWAKYDEHRDAEEKLQGFSMCNEMERSSEDEEQMSGSCSGDVDPESASDEAGEVKKSRTRPRMNWISLKKKTWRTFEDPYSSRAARALGFISLILSVALVAQFCLKTLEFFKDETSVQRRSLFAIEIACVSWFTLDLIMRFSCCPKKIAFFKTLHNWADLISILPFFVSSITSNVTIRNFEVLYVLRMSRTFRPLKFSYVMQVFTQTLRASSRELCFLIFILGIQVIVYGSITYFAERYVEDTLFINIPASFWWVIVTMTTVGYGDMSPSTTAGKFVGCACALSGVLMIALPVSVVASNFSLYNSYAKVKLKLPARSKKRVVDTALKALQVNTLHACVNEGGNSPKPRYLSSVATEMEMTNLIAPRVRALTGGGETSKSVTEDDEPANGTRRLGRRSAHFSVNLVPIRATPELPEVNSESAEDSDEANTLKPGHTDESKDRAKPDKKNISS